MLDVPIISHCEDEGLSAGGSMNEGYTSTVLGLAGIPKESEEIMVARDLTLAELTGARLHICHVSTKRSVELIREAKRRGVKVTCEVTPHHFTLTEEAVKSFDTNTKVNPPLRTKEDIRAIEKGLKDGTIDVIASDHAPHLSTEKEFEYETAPFGMIGLQTTLSLVMKQLVERKILTSIRSSCKTHHQSRKNTQLKERSNQSRIRCRPHNHRPQETVAVQIRRYPIPLQKLSVYRMGV